MLLDLNQLVDARTLADVSRHNPPDLIETMERLGVPASEEGVFVDADGAREIVRSLDIEVARSIPIGGIHAH